MTALKDAMASVKCEGMGGTMDFTDGSREAYSEFKNFILIDGQNIVLEDWMENGGYDEYKAATGRDR